ncbi:glycohydrolase toxin TNT-related protein [Microbacterium proteolyticum]|uniref:glycohydrolase toxin TNT-related protein n=2 Tax=Microbacterium TaxID=33882 RepID=UPI002415995A|nr:glycohydrolase toxin TNT-related protein [Microbacterium proteolyticum]
MPDAIKVGEIPGDEIKPEVVEENARTIGTISGQVSEHGSNVHFKWQGMAGVYEAPESPTLLGLMAPVSSQATQVSDNLAEVSAALIAFAADVRPIKAELDSLRVQAQAFVDSIQGGVQVREINPAWTAAQSPYGGATAMPTYQGSWGSSTTGSSSAAAPEQYRTVTKEWHESQDHVDRNNELIAAVNAQQVKLWEAERACANRIRALYGAQPLHAATSEDDALGYGISEIPEGTDMPWGAEVERTEGCGEATANFVFKDFLWEGIIVGGVWGTVTGLGTLVLGYNPETGEFFSGDAWGAAWGNLGLIAVSGLANSPMLGPLFWTDSLAQATGMGGFLPQEVRDFKAKADEAALNTGKALIAWDKWQDDPGTALGESVFNVGTALIPVGGAAVAGVKTASTAASVISKMARVADFVDPAALAMNGALRLGGAGIGSLDSIIGRLGSNATDGFHLTTPDMPFVADDAASALRALDDAGVDLNSITARIEDGVPVYEFPPTDAIPSGRVEMPAGSFDGVRGGDVPVRTDGGADAGVAAPVREPELVSAGGVRGEAGPGPVNSIVEDAPVRTETDGSGESTVVREPSTETGGGSSHAGGQGGSETGNGGGLGRGGDDANGGGRGDDANGGQRGEDANAGRGGDDANTGRGDDGADTGRGDDSTGSGNADDGASHHGIDDGDTGSGRLGDDVAGDPENAGAVPPKDPDAPAWQSTEQSDLFLSAPEKVAVDDFLADSRAAEPRITDDLLRIVGDQPGARLEGLEFRLKGDDSMYRKVSADLGYGDLPGVRGDVDSVLGNMKDSVRYTVIVPTESYAAGTRTVIDSLASDGYQPYGTFKNTWGADGYQGINSNWVDPASGRVIEVQFHTEESFAAKMQTHTLYEMERLPGNTPETLADLRAQQQEIFSQIPRPSDAPSLGWPQGVDIVDPSAAKTAVDDGLGSPAGAHPHDGTDLAGSPRHADDGGGTPRSGSETQFALPDQDVRPADGIDSATGPVDPSDTQRLQTDPGSDSPSGVADGHAPALVDANGRDLSTVVGRSDLNAQQLDEYLRADRPQDYATYEQTGVWPADVQIPRGPEVLAPNHRVDWSQVPHDGFATRTGSDGEVIVIREDGHPAAGTLVDRYGPGGRFTSPIGEDGPADYASRSLPYVEDPAHYHQYEVTGDLSDIPAAVRNHPDAELRQEIGNLMNAYQLSFEDLRVQVGPIAPGFGQRGGGTQYLFPLSTDMMERLGLIKEVRQ